MFVLIDNTNREKIIFFYYIKDAWKEKEFLVNSGNGLLFYFDKLLSFTKQQKEDLEGLAVLVGKGSFTSTRIATTVANTFGFSLKIPVVGVKEIKLDILLKQIKKVKIGQYISAKYSGEPNIGIKKVKK